MGGKAFSSYDHPINIVRLSPSDYFLLRDHVLSTLRPLYERVACPTAAPAKSFHGDVDILVTSPLPKRVSLNIEPDANSTSAAGHQPDHLLAIQCHLQAPYLHRSKPTSSFAVPHPVIPDAFAQVDIHVVPSDASFDWLLMHQSHGDFWIIVARALRSLGFSVTDTGLYLRDPTIATYDYGKKFLLTDDPMEVLSFLELDPGLFFRDASFESLEAMFRYISGMRWFHLDSFKSNSDAGMTSKEKKKLATRAQYRDFCQAWVPNQVGPATFRSLSVTPPSFSLLKLSFV